MKEAIIISLIASLIIGVLFGGIIVVIYSCWVKCHGEKTIELDLDDENDFVL